MTGNGRTHVVLAVLLRDVTVRVTAVASAVMVAVGVLVAAQTNLGLYAPGWANPLNFALTTNIYLAPIAAGATVVLVQELHQRQLATLVRSASRGAVRAVALRAGAVLVSAVLTHAAIVTVLLARYPPADSPSLADLGLTALALTVLGSSVAVGAALGWVGRGALLGPAVALVLFTAQYVASYLPGWRGRLSPLFPDVFFPSDLQPNLPLLAGQALLAVSVATAVWLLAVRSTRVLAVLPAVGVVAAVLVVATTGNEPVVTRAAPTDPLCSARADVTLCVRQVNSFAAAPSLDALLRTVDATRPFFTVATSFNEPGVRGAPASGLGVYYPPGPADGDYAYVDAAIRAAVPLPQCGLDGGPNSADSLRDLILWARGRVDPTLVPGYAAERLGGILDQPGTAQRAWVTDKVALASDCGR